ncbi:MAG: hypothetical protein ACREWE_08735 [Gammaproteobacteria bacterium]
MDPQFGGPDLVRQHATGQHRGIGYWVCIAGIEHATEAVIRHDKTSDEAYRKPMYLDAEADALLPERCWPMSRKRLQATAPDRHPAAGARHGS